jgi:heptosyltransferase III
MEILLLHPGGLGDTILALPAVALLRARFPAARVAIAGNIDHLAAVADGYADTVLSISALPLHGLYAGNDLQESEQRFWKSFDRIISWTGAGHPRFIANLKRILPDAAVEPWKPEPKETRHVAQIFIDSLGHGITAGMKAFPALIRISPETMEKGEQWLSERGWKYTDSLVALHPGAGSKSKRWPLPRFVQLGRHLSNQAKEKLLIVEGPAEPGIAEQMAREIGDAWTIESLPLNVLAAVLVRARLFVGNDSGISHLAAALGIPTVVLFGPTLPQHWAPLGPDVTVLRDSRGCKGCDSVTGTDEHSCMENIEVETLIQGTNPG